MRTPTPIQGIARRPARATPVEFARKNVGWVMALVAALAGGAGTLIAWTWSARGEYEAKATTRYVDEKVAPVAAAVAGNTTRVDNLARDVADVRTMVNWNIAAQSAIADGINSRKKIQLPPPPMLKER